MEKTSCYAVLGATGSTGSAILTNLLENPNTKINVYCRSKQKLIKQFPGIEGNKAVQIFDGSFQDVQLMTNCLRGTKAAFHCVAAGENTPGCSICMDTAEGIVAACKELKANGQPRPKLVVLSSNSTEHRFVPNVPVILEAILYRAFSAIYDDLKVAENFLRSHHDLLSSSFVKPSALCFDSRKGHVLSMEMSEGPLSFMDLAAGMIEIADDENGLYEMQSVTVNPTAKDVAFPWQAPANIARGLLFHFLPWSYAMLGYT